MRLHRLELTGLGPFAGTQSVDLDRLGADGLFLLYGDTGAGKTSVLDAISYALFNRVPGSRQQAGRLRCDQAAPDVASSVCLELTLGGRRLRVRRSLEWQRPKRRGVGTTRQPASAALEEWRADTWVGLSTRIDEVSQQLLDWIGMSADQFFQVVLLPQGDFARFLRADSLEREALLERLFGTRRFTQVQDWLADRRGNAKLSLEKAEGELHIWLQRLCQELGIDHAQVPGPAAATLAWREEQVDAAEDAVRAAETAAEASAQAMAAARATAEQARTRRRLHQRRVLAEQEQQSLQAATDRTQQARERLAAAHRAAALPPLLAAVAAAEQDHLNCTRDVESRLRSTAGLLVDLEPGAGESVLGRGAGSVLAADLLDAKALGTLEQRLREECVRLRDLTGRVEEHTEVLAALATAEATLAGLQTHTAQAQVQYQRLPGRIADAAEREVQSSTAVAALPGLRAAVQQGEALLAAASAEAASGVALSTAQDRLRLAVDEHQAATALVQQLRERRLAGMAAELAGALADGQACPVCGSCKHPTPAEGADLVTDTEEQSAAAVLDSATVQRHRCERDVHRIQTELAGHRARTGGRPAAEVDAELIGLRKQRRAAEDMAAKLTERTAASAALRRDHEALGSLLAEAQSSTAQSRERAAQLRSAADRLGAILAAARGRDDSLQARIDRLDAAAEDIAGLLAALHGAAAAGTALAQAQGAAQQQASAAGFSSLAEAAAAVATTGQIAGWQREVEDYERRAAALDQLLTEPGLTDPEVIAAVSLPTIDLEPTTRAQLLAEEAHTHAVAALTALRRRAAEVRRLADLLAAAEVAAAPARQEYADVRALADLVAGLGQNTRHMTLRAYVLAARLAEVAESASRRLQQMSGGRFTFQHTDVADSARVRAGLGLVVVDDYSGLARSTKTLSGGESFLASLALALGLADVVTAEAGGVQLETLFIDEGFGSLDADTLDQVMSTLDELRAGGRVVGVVSHVEDMRARIPSRLLVHKRRDGSTLEQISA